MARTGRSFPIRAHLASPLVTQPPPTTNAPFIVNAALRRDRPYARRYPVHLPPYTLASIPAPTTQATFMVGAALRPVHRFAQRVPLHLAGPIVTVAPPTTVTLFIVGASRRREHPYARRYPAHLARPVISVPVTGVPAAGTALALVWAMNVATAQIWAVSNAPWLSGLNGIFFIEQISLSFTPGQNLLTAQIQLFDYQQGIG